MLILSGMAVGLAAITAFADPAPETLIASGKRIYLEGRLKDGTPLRATVIGDVSLRGDKMACVSCHRRSGLGTVEGKILIPPVTGDLLFQPKKTSGHQRPGYTKATLSRAIRDGMDAAGRPLEPLMPHYLLDDENMRALTAYLGTLSTKAAPGVTDETIRFATVVTEDAGPEDRRAMLDVLERFVRDKNGGTRQETHRARAWTSSVRKNHYLPYREWALSAWELTGPPETWRAQLEEHYRQQPVFALLSGIGTRGWEPVHRFCEDLGLPCLLPITDRPAITEADFYTLYFSRGLALEAQIAARFLGDRPGAGRDARIVQVFRNDETGRLMSRAFRAAWEGRGGTNVEDQMFARDQEFTGGFWKRFVDRTRPPVLLLWLPRADLAGWRDLDEKTLTPVNTVFLAWSLIGEAPLSVSPAVREKLYMTYPYNPPRADRPQFPREESWLRIKKLDSGSRIIKAKTLFACTVAGEALKHIENIFSREYFLERIEHALDSSALTSIYPQVSLGPDQRFAAKGAYVVRPAAAPGALVPVGGWIIP